MDSEKNRDRERDNRWLTLITVAINGFLIILDISIVNISFPRLTRVFDTEPSVVLWISVVYALLTVGLMLVLGRIGDIYGRKKIFVIGYILFTAGLILCSISQNIVQLILSRVVQGIGGAMNMALSIALVTGAFPGSERGKALGIMSSVFAIGPLLGFTIGGFLLEALGWRSIFYTRVPICILGIFMAWKLLEEKKAPGAHPKIDLLGAGALFGSLSCLLLFLNLGGRSGFMSSHVILLGVIALLLSFFFLFHENRCEQPVMDLNIFNNGMFTGGSISLILFGLAQSSHFFLLPYYLISGAGYSSAVAGLFMAVPTVFFSSLAPVSGWLSDKSGPRPWCIAGMIFLCAGLFISSRFGMNSGPAVIVTGLAVFGIGGSIFFTPNANLLMGVAPRDRLGTVGALISTVRQIGMSIGIATAGMLLTIRQASHAADLAGRNLDPSMLERLSLIGGYRDTMLIAVFIGLAGLFSSSFIGSNRHRTPQGRFSRM